MATKVKTLKFLGSLIFAALAGVVLALAKFTAWQVFALVTAITLWNWSMEK